MKTRGGLGALVALVLAGCGQQFDGGDAMAGLRELVPRRVGADADVAASVIEPMAGGRSTSDLSYLDRLMELRTQHDLLPFFEPLAAGVPGVSGPAGVQFPQNSVANDERKATRSRPYEMLAEELLEWGYTVRPGTGFGNLGARVHVNLSMFEGKRPEHLPPFVRDDLLLGQLSGDLTRFRGGLMLRDDVEWNLAIQLRDAVPANYTGVFTPTLRGYRLYEKGSQRPTQRTYPEYAALGYKLAPYPQQVQLTLAAAPSTEEATPVELTFPADMVIDTVLVELAVDPWGGTPADPTARIANLLARIEPDSNAPMMGGWVSLPAVGYGKTVTSARWVIPYTVGRDSSWRFRVRKAYDDNFGDTITVTFVLLGSKLIPPRPKR